MRVIRVVIADDDDAVRGALREVLQEDSRFTVVGEAATGAELEALLEAVRTDVVLLDVRMPGGGPAGVRAVLSRHRAPVAGDGPVITPLVIAVSAEAGAATVVAMVRAGAVGYLAKGRLGALPDMVARCSAGEVLLAVPSGADALQQLMRIPAP